MEDSITHPTAGSANFVRPTWMTVVSVVSAVLLAVLMLSAGLWKATDPIGWSTKLHQLLFPAAWTLPATIALAITETLAGVLLLVPRFRRWGAWLTGLLLVAFMVYVAIFYNRLLGAECSCFPWIERAIGPGFFVGDVAMLGLAVLAGLWAAPSRSFRGAALVLGAVAVFVGVSYGVVVAEQSNVEVSETITVAGQPVALDQGRLLLYFYDPECTTCFFAARDLSALTWKDTRVIGIPTRMPQFAQNFLNDTGLKAEISNDLEKLHGLFEFGDPPYAVALENGRQLAALSIFEGDGWQKPLVDAGFAE